MRHTALLLISLMLTAALAAGCGSDPTPTDTPSAQPPEPSEPSPSGPTVTSEIVDFKLENLTVKAGTSIVWKNLDGAPHNATSGGPPAGDGEWDTADLGKDESAKPITFNETGTFDYFCTIHAYMTATLTVTE